MTKFGEKTGLGHGQRPSEIDAIAEEGGLIVGYEFKDYDSSTWGWMDYKNNFGQINAGLKKLSQEGKIINSYKFVFKEKPPLEVINWLDSDANKIPWTYLGAT